MMKHIDPFALHKTSVLCTMFCAFVLFSSFLPVFAVSDSLKSDKFFHLDFRFDDAAVDLTYRSNQQALDELDDLFANIGMDNVLRVQAVSVSSPEGSYTYNIALSVRRARSTADFVAERFPGLSDCISVLPGSESWKELSEAVKNDRRLTDASKGQILGIVDSSLPVNDKKALLKYSLSEDANVGDAYRYLIKYIYPKIRYSGFAVTYLSGGDTVVVGETPVIQPLERDVPSTLVFQDVDNAIEPLPAAGAPAYEPALRDDDPSTAVPAVSPALSTDDSADADTISSVSADTHDTSSADARPSDSLEDRLTSQDAVSAQADSSALTIVYRTPWHFWLLLALLLAGIALLTFWVVRLRQENYELKERIDIIASKSKAELERVRNVERVEELDVETNDDKLMKSIMSVINENISNPELSVEFIADKIGLSRSYLSRRFKSIVQTTPAAFIRGIRMEAASKMLREGKLDINQISSAVGFSSPSSFTTAFKSYYGMTPTEYAQ